MQLPEEFLNKMKTLLKDEYDQYLDSFDHAAIHSLRVNTKKISVENFLKIAPFNMEPIPWASDGFYFDDNLDKVTKHSYYYAGLYYIQEASAMLPAEVLDIDEGDIILDACAAPGGKSTKLINKFNEGLLISNDISVSRAQGLLKNLERFGSENYYVISQDISNFSKHQQTFDKILIDAPCSGEGMFRKDPSLIKSWLEKGNSYYANIQKNIIDKAIDLLNDGGQLVYSTCTFDTQEDEKIIEYALDNHPELTVLPIKHFPGFKAAQDNLGVKLFPHRIKGEGHYVCKLQKAGNINKTITHNDISCPNLDFFKHLNKKFNNGSFEIIKDHLYFKKDFNTNNIRVLRSGLLLGTIKNNDLEPSQALALNLKCDEFDQVIHFDVDDPRVLKYLKGETIKLDNQFEGYVLICVNDYPLGFGKVTNGQFKNKIDKGWIYR